MQLWPAKTEMFLSPHGQHEIIRRMELAVKPVKFQSFSNRSLGEIEEEAFLFNGKVGSNGFAISKIVSRPNNFLPLIKGRIEGGESGSLVHLEFSLFPSIKYFLLFWIMLMLLFSIISIVQEDDLLTIIFPLVILLASYALIISRFNDAYQKSRKELMRLIG
ncbi:hypothetical protein MATR_01460 [Marivirga tractuosa]|uniref:Uncharacterized protein n=1 Tax=Marivirga tractuosa (strain ATCC 23168 / DSM 4126 / NBRC 15989 / NCIMB 1408 / VKM B-1430 / H-43) TaxID=643867 RepID=E4TVW4_MARTH|nr:hypothetical protein [Marivirga tractuosa]ADR22212.1 hypothetical protein Ftrac_2233 [Marivirga tractuosa DSM 4126]BDD13321.1 hypothetical protein MATR_01460 [Marivirga tractuosa]